ncbi:MAG TPA: efflux RND transporter periplasmic adaptor subunit [Spirochaetia bacterium]|nr:efflux RND transporter periplasmic adaptor subunit [Spirochaetia bacterium]
MKFLKILKKIWWLLLIVVLIGGYFAINASVNNAKDPKIKTVTVQREDLVDELSVSGEIDAEEKASLRFQTSGLLTWVGVKEGDYVKKYQSLASLDKRELQNNMSKYLNTYSKTRWDFEQAQDDNKDWQTAGMTDEARTEVKRTLDKYQFDLNNSVLSVEAQALALKFANLWTPIEGLVTKVEAPLAGQNITPATATFEIVNPKTVYFSATADQTEVTKFKVGQKGSLVLDSFSDTPIEGTVTSIGFTPMADQTGTVYELKISLATENNDYSVRMGMTGDIKFIFKEIMDVLVVPASYVKNDDGEDYVFKMVGKEKQKTVVKLGETIDGNTEILSGLNEKDVIYSN